jgi:hypothetical protein
MAPHPCILWTLRSIARLERAGGIRPPRLTEPGFAHWHRIRRRLGWRELIALLHEDLASAFPLPFELSSWQAPALAGLNEAEAERLVNEAAVVDDSDPHAFLRAAARAFDLPSGGALSQLPRAMAHHKVLELGFGRIAAAQVIGQTGLAFHDQFVFVADNDAQRALIGLAAVEARANPPLVLTVAELRAQVQRGQRFDRVLGLPTPLHEQLAGELGLDAKWA